jgi:SPP1 family predicted phage head-tail adaptor
MNIGRLRNRIELFALERVRQANGSFKDAYVSMFCTWAEVRAVNGEEGRLAYAQSALVKYRVLVRYRTDVMPSMIVKNLDENRFMHIRAILDVDGKRDFLELSCEWKQGQNEPS